MQARLVNPAPKALNFRGFKVGESFVVPTVKNYIGYIFMKEGPEHAVIYATLGEKQDLIGSSIFIPDSWTVRKVEPVGTVEFRIVE